jgi:hypothetical protein
MGRSLLRPYRLGAEKKRDLGKGQGAEDRSRPSPQVVSGWGVEGKASRSLKIERPGSLVPRTGPFPCL